MLASDSGPFDNEKGTTVFLTMKKGTISLLCVLLVFLLLCVIQFPHTSSINKNKWLKIKEAL
jgi:hypothetical protein